MIRVILTLMAISTFARASEHLFDYFQQGRDWNNTCKTGLKQSPIDIPTPGGKDHQSHLHPAENMNALMWYSSLTNGIVEDDDHCVRVNFRNGTLAFVSHNNEVLSY